MTASGWPQTSLHTLTYRRPVQLKQIQATQSQPLGRQRVIILLYNYRIICLEKLTCFCTNQPV